MAADRPAARPGLLERLEQGPVICAEGYLFEFERRGYLQAGAFVPEVVLEHPELVAQLHREFVHAGSDVVEAFTYYGHREKLRIIGKEELLEPLNRQALALAKEVADETGTLFAGDICNTNVFEPDDDDSIRAVRMMFEEQVGWAAEAGADFVIAETISHVGEALLALETIKAAGLPAVVTMAVHRDPVTRDGWTIAEACKRLEDAGADVVGVNCIRGPTPRCRCSGRSGTPSTATSRRYRSLPDARGGADVPGPAGPGAHDLPDGRPFPTALEPLACNRYEIAEFGRAAFELGVRYLGVCCGNAPHYTRSLAEALGRTPPASRYSPDMSKHAYYGSDERLKESNREFAREL